MASSNASSGGSSSGSGGKNKHGTITEENAMVVKVGDAIQLSPDLVASTALASFNIHSGILLLEEAIMRNDSNHAAFHDNTSVVEGAGAKSRGQSGKTKKNTPVAGDMDSQRGGNEGGGDRIGDGGDKEWQQGAWLQLSKLYGALGERDALVGVSYRASRLEETRCVRASGAGGGVG